MRSVTRPFAIVLPLVILSLAGACFRKTTSDLKVPEIVLEAYNGSFFEVVVYGLPTTAGPRIRIGTAGSFATTMLPVPHSAWRAGGSLALQLHAIGTNRSWTLPELPMAWDLTPCLEIYADASGDMSRSNFYSVVTPDSQPAMGTRTTCGFMATVGDAPLGRSQK